MDDSGFLALGAPRVPPSNLQAEQALLGAILANNAAQERVAAFLRAEHFADPIHGRIYEIAARRIESGRLVDALTLKAELEHSGTLDDVGGTMYLGQLLSAMVGIINAGEYGRAIVDAWHRRQLIDIAERLHNEAYGAGEAASAAEVHERAEAALYELGERGRTDEAVSPAYQAMDLAINAAVLARDAPTGLVGVTSGLQAIDDMTGGWRRGRLYVVGARPSMGKSTFAVTCGIGASLAGHRVLMASLEMTRQDVGAQITAGLAQIKRNAVERGRVQERDALGRFQWRPITDDEVSQMMVARQRMVDRHFMIDEVPSRTLAGIRAQARRMKRRGGLDLLIIDYLGLLRMPGLERGGNRTEVVSRLAADAKQMAKDLDVPVMLLSQLNRANEGREDKRPGLADLRESGEVEAAADAVILLHREHYYLSRQVISRKPDESEERYATRVSSFATAESEARGRAEANFAKARAGAVGTRFLRFDDEVAWFSDIEV